MGLVVWMNDTGGCSASRRQVRAVLHFVSEKARPNQLRKSLVTRKGAAVSRPTFTEVRVGSNAGPVRSSVFGQRAVGGKTVDYRYSSSARTGESTTTAAGSGAAGTSAADWSTRVRSARCLTSVYRRIDGWMDGRAGDWEVDV
jgi:hypothetical protein